MVSFPMSIPSAHTFPYSSHCVIFRFLFFLTLNTFRILNTPPVQPPTNCISIYIEVQCQSPFWNTILILLYEQFFFFFCQCPCFLLCSSAWSPDKNTEFYTHSKSFFCTLSNHLSFNFRRKSESKSKNFALNIVTENKLVFDRINFCFSLHTEVKNIHHHIEVTTKTAYLRTDYHVSLIDEFQ